jgi:hypothetical protein
VAGTSPTAQAEEQEETSCDGPDSPSWISEIPRDQDAQMGFVHPEVEVEGGYLTPRLGGTVVQWLDWCESSAFQFSETLHKPEDNGNIADER